MTRKDDKPGEDDRSIERSLDKALSRRALSEEALERVRARVQAEFQRSLAGPAQRRRRTRYYALAASVCALMVAAMLWYEARIHSLPVATLVQVTGEGVFAEDGDQTARVASGSPLLIGNMWDARAPARAALSVGGTIRMAKGAVVRAERPNELSLIAGRVYLDFPENAGRFLLHTHLGVVVHVGTQFEATQTGGRLRVRVRQGSVRIHSDTLLEQVDEGMEVVLEAKDKVIRGVYPTDGHDWDWVDTVRPPYDIENRSLNEFLSWVGRETGRRILYVDPRAREVATQTRLHGSVDGLLPLQALDQVLSTTSLKFDLVEGTIRVSSRR